MFIYLLKSLFTIILKVDFKKYSLIVSIMARCFKDILSYYVNSEGIYSDENYCNYIVALYKNKDINYNINDI